MKIILGAVLVLSLLCGQSWAQLALPVNAAAQKVIDQSKTQTGLLGQEAYLVTQGKEFLKQKNYDAAYTVGSYVLAQLNAKSAGAKSLITAAQSYLSPELQKTVAGLTAKADAATKAAQEAGQTVNSLKGLWATPKK
jgi:hypothetical protein